MCFVRGFATKPKRSVEMDLTGQCICRTVRSTTLKYIHIKITYVSGFQPEVTWLTGWDSILLYGNAIGWDIPSGISSGQISGTISVGDSELQPPTTISSELTTVRTRDSRISLFL
ncbi:hypothetical protein CEXT_726361 [Caerostris extrusa]|uniref:Uncharacterized protein n=1 Tax=Caerostris extrusa TaxID=172846 RepID=A0AAV4XNP7_CAEEX|nr:hypothetical protein CEXT_726361 [Caerostris extrusa]